MPESIFHYHRAWHVLSLFGFYYDKKSISEVFVNRLEMRFQIPLNNLKSESQFPML